MGRKGELVVWTAGGRERVVTTAANADVTLAKAKKAEASKTSGSAGSSSRARTGWTRTFCCVPLNSICLS